MVALGDFPCTEHGYNKPIVVCPFCKQEKEARIAALEGVVEAAEKLVDLVVEHFEGCTYTKSMPATSCSCGISGLLDALAKLEEV